MLRLCPSGFKHFSQVVPGNMDVTFGDGEANACASLAMLVPDFRLNAKNKTKFIRILKQTANDMSEELTSNFNIINSLV